MTRTCPMPASPGRGRGRGVGGSVTPQVRLCLDVIGRVERGETGKGPTPRQRCPNLGPTRQDTLLYFKTGGHQRSKAKAQKTDVTDDRRRPEFESVTAQSSSEESGQATSDTTSVQKHHADNDTSKTIPSSHHRLCVSSLLFRRENTVLTSRPGSYVTSEYSVPSLLESMVSVRGSRMEKRREKIITPSKHGYHPRSHSPTFKRLLEASEKLNQMVETLETSVKDTSTSSGTRTPTSTSMTLFTDPVDMTRLKLTGADRQVQTDTLRNGYSDVSDSSSDDLSEYYNTYRTLRRYQPHIGARLDHRKYVSVIQPKKHHVTPRVGKADVKVDCKQNGGQGTELHFFLPNIIPSSDTARSPEANDGEEPDVFRTSKSLPQLDYKINSLSSYKPRNGYQKRTRIISKRTHSPSKTVNRDKQRRGRVSEEREPFLRGESLKERLEDFPTLVSLDTS